MEIDQDMKVPHPSKQLHQFAAMTIDAPMSMSHNSHHNLINNHHQHHQQQPQHLHQHHHNHNHHQQQQQQHHLQQQPHQQNQHQNHHHHHHHHQQHQPIHLHQHHHDQVSNNLIKQVSPMNTSTSTIKNDNQMAGHCYSSNELHQTYSDPQQPTNHLAHSAQYNYLQQQQQQQQHHHQPQQHQHQHQAQINLNQQAVSQHECASVKPELNCTNPLQISSQVISTQKQNHTNQEMNGYPLSKQSPNNSGPGLQQTNGLPNNNQKYNQGLLAKQQSNDNVQAELLVLLDRTEKNEPLLRSCCEGYQGLVLQSQHRDRIKYELAAVTHDQIKIEKLRGDLSNIEALLKQRAIALNGQRHTLCSEIHNIFQALAVVQQQVLYERLPKWQLNQQMINQVSDISPTPKLDQIQGWVELLVDVISNLKRQLRDIYHSMTPQPNIPFNKMAALEKLSEHMNYMIEELIRKSFVVEKQPPQVMKTNTRFASTVRFLAGRRFDNPMTRPRVTAIILNEQNARSMISTYNRLLASRWPSAASLDTVAPDCSPTTSEAAESVTEATATATATAATTTTNTAATTTTTTTSNTTGHQTNVSTYQNHPETHVGSNNNNNSTQTISPTPNQFGGQAPHPHKRLFQVTAAAPQQGDRFLDLSQWEHSGDILNNNNQMECAPSQGQMVCHFKTMQLKRIKRTEKKGTESVMDEKFVVLFHSQLHIPHGGQPLAAEEVSPISSPFSFQLLAFSAPVVVIVHGNQEANAWATITWHNAFARPDQQLYQVPDRVPWRELGKVLSDQFLLSAGRGLGERNLHYLATKLLRARPDNDGALVTWAQFAKEPLANRTFTFWDWFHSIVKLTREHLRDLWAADRIHGFIDKRGCSEILIEPKFGDSVPVGTFLLRFSESECGGVTIAWVAAATNQQVADMSKPPTELVCGNNNHTATAAAANNNNVLMHLQPYKGKELLTRTLADRIRDLPDLVYLHPNIPKDEAFGDFYTPLDQITADGYVRPLLIQTLVTNYPGNGPHSASSTPMSCRSLQMSAAPTPSSFSQSSPEAVYQENTGFLLANHQMDTGAIGTSYELMESAEFSESI